MRCVHLVPLQDRTGRDGTGRAWPEAPEPGAQRVLGCACAAAPVLCQRSEMLFTHERGSEASALGANYPVLIFFGEKETRAFQTWPNLIS